MREMWVQSPRPARGERWALTSRRSPGCRRERGLTRARRDGPGHGQRAGQRRLAQRQRVGVGRAGVGRGWGRRRTCPAAGTRAPGTRRTENRKTFPGLGPLRCASPPLVPYHD